MSPATKRPRDPDRAGRREASYLFDPASIKNADAPPEDSGRLIWMFLSLIRRRELVYAAYYKEFRRGAKTFARDISKLREIGTQYQFTLTRQRRGRVALASLADVADPRRLAEAVAADTLRAVADALGELVANDVLGYVDASRAPREPFLRIATPQLVGQSNVARIYDILRSAWTKHSRVQFRYPVNRAKAGSRATEERTVEPHLVTYYDGRYYLVAFDRRPRTNAWRQFALDRIEGTIALAGTFEPRVVPRHYRGEDAVGLFKSGPRFDVVIELSPTIAQSVTGRLWQRHQRTEDPAGSWPAIVFEVFDLREAVRWAFSFGAYARIVAPPRAVSLACEMAGAMLAAHTQIEAPPREDEAAANDRHSA